MIKNEESKSIMYEEYNEDWEEDNFYVSTDSDEEKEMVSNQH